MDINSIPTLAQLEQMSEEDVMKLVHPDHEVLPIAEIAAIKPPNGDIYPTGLELLDKAMLGGFRGGDLVVLSGMSGHGKTSLAQTMTYWLTKRTIPCLWFSYEVSVQRLHEKFVAMGIEPHYHAFAPKRNQSGNVEWIEQRIIEGVKKYMTQVIFIDHIDFLTPTSIKTSDNENIALKKVATELKQLAIKLNVVIVLMAHVRKVPSGKEPEMQDISSSSGIFQLADYVIITQRLMEKNSNPFSRSGDVFSNTNKTKLVKNRLTGDTVFFHSELRHGLFVAIWWVYDPQYAITRPIHPRV